MREPSLRSAKWMRFLGEEHDLDEVGWDNPALALLWRYNQHYFDDLNAINGAARRAWHEALIERWRAENPPGRGTAYAPYPTSLRLVNWAKWFLGGAAPTPATLDSLALQARWLARRIEWHLRGNHLFVNAKALVFAGLFFEGLEAEGWLQAGLAILARELPEQVLADGGQFERSPMYQALALEDLLDLLNLVQALAPPDSPARGLDGTLRECSAAMLQWLRHMTHPGGALVRFNDCAPGIAPANAELDRYAAALGISAPLPAAQSVTRLEPSGYVRVACGPATAWLDLAPIGPDYLPGHAHADTLSFEVSLAERELIVNRGTSVYGTGPRRQIERGTAAHSTVQIGAHDSSEVWSGFRVGRRARPGPVQIEDWQVQGSHDGYAHLPGRPQHHRRWQFHAMGLIVEDKLDPPAREGAQARYHLAPGIELRALGGQSWQMLERGLPLARVDVQHGSAQVERWLHAERFGTLVDAQTLCIGLVGGSARVHWSWGP